MNNVRYIATILASFIFSNLCCQIYMADSTVQVVGYWSVNDSQTYSVSYETYKMQKLDTLRLQSINYEVDVMIKDSTADGYLIEWFYRDFKVQSEIPVVQKLMAVAEDISVVIRADEFGAIQEVVNWEEVRDYIQSATVVLKQEFKSIPEADQMIDKLMLMYTSKESIEANSIKDALQIYNYHGGKYKLNEVLTGHIQVSNNYGGDPFDVQLSVSLDEIYPDEGNSVLRMHESVDSVQLTNATFSYLKEMETFGANIPSREDFPPLTSETWSASRIHGATGWVIYSIETKEIESGDQVRVEERIIELQGYN